MRAAAALRFAQADDVVYAGASRDHDDDGVDDYDDAHNDVLDGGGGDDDDDDDDDGDDDDDDDDDVDNNSCFSSLSCRLSDPMHRLFQMSMQVTLPAAA